jgi:periplasmic divalent cation tolerance protein
MTDCVLVWTTLAAETDAAAFAETLVAEGLAACVAVHGPMDSFYRWKGHVQHDREQQIVIKTTTGSVAALAARVQELHPYELPEWLVTPVIDGSEDYLAWVRDAVHEA